ncbi:hypothetical protein OKW41_002093 [Paraburkholderia sp. UCT70]|uniref:hypothetical protein n=1 Tax=Paraburkholderia sp. UCT70 TaxID=2991068 RepID=UPI003D1FC8AD
MNEQPRIPRPLAPGGLIVITMIVLMAIALFALVMTGASAGVIWLVRWIASTGSCL